MSLWTPSGEHPVGDEGGTPGTGRPFPGRATPPPSSPPPPQAPPAQPPSGPGGAEPDPEAAASVDELRRQLAEAPPEVVVANHCYGLFELAAVYLSQAPPRLAQAQVAIDALGYLVEGLGERLGEAHGPLRDALAQVRLAYVQLGTTGQGRAGPGEPPTGNGQGQGTDAPATGTPGGAAPAGGPGAAGGEPGAAEPGEGGDQG